MGNVANINKAFGGMHKGGEQAELIFPQNSSYLQASADLVQLYAPIANEILQLENFISANIISNVAIINSAADYLIASGGKRIRPVILIAIAKMLGADTATNSPAIKLGAIVEFIHSATLLHDDVVDDSNIRRGRKTINNIHGNAISVLVGDFMYSRAFQIMADIKNAEITRILSYATNIIAEGEIIQLSNIGNLFLTREEYLTTIFCKTAKLFEAAGELAVVIACENNQELLQYQEIAGSFGRHLGNAFQLTDDALDYSANSTNSGKAGCKDLLEGKITLPLLIALEKSDNAQELRAAISQKTSGFVEKVLSAIAQSKSVEETLTLAQNELNLAREYLQKLPADFSPSAKKLLQTICAFVAERIF